MRHTGTPRDFVSRANRGMTHGSHSITMPRGSHPMKKTTATASILASALFACGISLVGYWYCIGPDGRSAYDRSAPVPGWMIYERDLMWKRYAFVFGVTSAIGGAALA